MNGLLIATYSLNGLLLASDILHIQQLQIN